MKIDQNFKTIWILVKVYNMMTNKFKKLFEFMKNIKPIIKEVSTFGVLSTLVMKVLWFFKNFSDYERVSPKHFEIGWTSNWWHYK